MHMRVSVSLSVVSDSLRPHRLQPARLLCPWNTPGKNTGMAAIPFSRDLPHCRQILYHLSHQKVSSNHPAKHQGHSRKKIQTEVRGSVPSNYRHIIRSLYRRHWSEEEVCSVWRQDGSWGWGCSLHVLAWGPHPSPCHYLSLKASGYNKGLLGW